MADRTVRLRMNHPVIVTLLILAIIAFMYFAAEVLRPLALALLLCLVLAPLCAWLERRGLPRIAAVVLTVFVVLGGLGGVGYVVIQQLNAMVEQVTDHLPEFKEKLHTLNDAVSGSRVREVTETLQEVSEEVTRPSISKADEAETNAETPVVAEEPEAPGLDVPPRRLEELAAVGNESAEQEVMKVEVLDQPTIQERFSSTVGPIIEPATIFSIVLVLTLFMLANREDLLGRVIQVIGLSHVSLTTRTLDEAGRRISKYLTTFTFYNLLCGVILGIGLWLIGVPYAVLWGFLVFVLRFIPYVGPMTAFVLPLGYAVAFSDGWREPAMVVALFVIFEAFSEYAMEPILYGRTTGITAVGLLVSAMFWTWLWGAPGLLLSTPLTVCLAVLGKYVPALKSFATMLGEEAVLDLDVQYYQRLLARDQDGAFEIVEQAMDGLPRGQVFDEILIPALSRAEGDRVRGAIDEDEQAFIWHVTRCLLDELEHQARGDESAPPAEAGTGRARSQVVGVASDDASDTLALRMLQQELAAREIGMTIVTEGSSSDETAERIAEMKPAVVLLSHLPPVGLTSARQIVRRLRHCCADAPLWVGRWRETGNIEKVRDRIERMGADEVVVSIEEARDRLAEAMAEGLDDNDGKSSKRSGGKKKGKEAAGSSSG